MVFFLSGRRVHAVRDAAGALGSAGKWRFYLVHRAVLHHYRALQRERPGDRGHRGGPSDFACAAAEIQKHHHPQQHREVHRGLLDLRDRRRPLTPHSRTNHRKDAVVQVITRSIFVNRRCFVEIDSSDLC